MIPFCRVSPATGTAPDEARRALAAGAKGIKLHPRAEQFTLDHPAVRELAQIADERRLPILIHAGRGIPALGRHTVELAGEFPDARFILAHAGITDLAWIWRVAADLPNLLFDTAWFMGADLRALYTLVPPGQILFASDAPYGNTLLSGVTQIRLALQLGLSHDQIRSIMSEQSLRIAAGEPLQPAGPAVGEGDRAPARPARPGRPVPDDGDDPLDPSPRRRPGDARARAAGLRRPRRDRRRTRVRGAAARC